MKLSKSTLANIPEGVVQKPPFGFDQLPEKVLQFGTGVLLRGLPDYFFDKANRNGLFNGRVVMVKSTRRGDVNSFIEQDNLYNICIRGIADGKTVEDNIICSAISRVLNVHGEWEAILACAHNPEMELIISNTTETGIELVEEDIFNNLPSSFPGKLLRFLVERYRAFDGADDKGMIIIPTELIEHNADLLKQILLDLANLNQLDAAFIRWMQQSNRFCNSLVDRIVPGKNKTIQSAVESAMGVTDQELIITEPFCLWAIEGDDTVRKKLSFADADSAVIVTRDIELFKELKLRLLNATHTLSCGVAILSGIPTVSQAMQDASLGQFISGLVQDDIAGCLPYPVPAENVNAFGKAVLERFSNPFIQHEWINITMNYSLKMRARVVPLLIQCRRAHLPIPERFALAFAAMIRFFKVEERENNQFVGSVADSVYPVTDPNAGRFHRYWTEYSKQVAVMTHQILSDTELWGTNLTDQVSFVTSVASKLEQILDGNLSGLIDENSLVTIA